MIKLEAAISTYFAVRRKKHGIGNGTRLRAFKLALCMYSAANGGPLASWHSRFAHWLAFHGTPRLPGINEKS